MELTKLKNKRFLAKGHRGLIYTATYNRKNVVVKEQRKDIAAKGTVNNEAEKLKVLNKYKIGPKLIFHGEDYFVYNYVKGDFVLDFLKKSNKNKIIKIISQIFEQLYVMDRLKLNKEEMHHPYKHIIIGKKPVMIDFERCKFSEKPKNVTQFCQFLISKKIMDILKNKNIVIDEERMKECARDYKHNPGRKRFEKILREFK